MAVLPTRFVEVEFTAGVWTDITADVVAVETRRGRNRESGAFETGTMTFTVRNDSRKYDPDNTAGPYYGRLRPNRRARFTSTWSAINFPVFQGYVDRITQNYGGPNDATATFELSDLFKILNRVELPTSAYVAEVRADNPVALWRLDEPLGSTTVSDSIGGRTLDVFGSPGFGSASLIAREPGTSLTIVDRSATGVWRDHALPVTGPPLTLEIVARKTPANDDGLWVAVVPQPLTRGAVWIQAAGTVVAFQTVNGSNSQVLATTTGVNLDDGLTHHIAATWDAAGTIKIYVDGVDRTSGSPSNANVAFTATRGIVAAAGGSSGSGVGLANEGVSQMAAIYNTALSPARIAAHAAQVSTPWAGDLSGARLTRIYDLAGLPTVDRATDAGSTTLQATALGGSALAYAQKVEETEAGRLFVSRAGKVTFISRYNGDTGTYLTSKAQLVDADVAAVAPPTVVPYRTVTADVDEATIVTRATVSRIDGTAQTYSDATAVTEFQLIDEIHEGLLHTGDDYSLAYAQWIVSTHKTPLSRVGTVTVELPLDPANMIPTILGLELGDRVTYKRKPQNTGATITQDMRVESIAHSTGPNYWTTALQLSPFNLGTGGYGTGVWDTSLWDQATWGL